jgi:lipopolysaccharide export system permease protein
MRVSTTLSGYIGRQFAVALVAFFAIFLIVVYMFDAIELLRRAGGRADASTGLVLRMALLKLPNMAEELAPFVVLSRR